MFDVHLHLHVRVRVRVRVREMHLFVEKCPADRRIQAVVC
jgi:hypothetical protein